MNAIKLLLLDVDGTLTDGKIYYSSSGEEIKAFNVKDGLGISRLQKRGVEIGIITGRYSSIVERRAEELGIKLVFQGERDKCAVLERILSQGKFKAGEIAYMGDDLNDLDIMKAVGYRICPNDACLQVKEISDFVTTRNGGDGAVREFIDYLFTQIEISDGDDKDFIQ